MMKPQGLRLLHPQGKKETDMTASSLVKVKGGKTLQHFLTITLDKKLQIVALSPFCGKKLFVLYACLQGQLLAKKEENTPWQKQEGELQERQLRKSKWQGGRGTQQVHFPSSLFLPDPSSFGKRAEKWTDAEAKDYFSPLPLPHHHGLSPSFSDSPQIRSITRTSL